MLDFTEDLGIKVATGMAGPQTATSLFIESRGHTEIGLRSLLLEALQPGQRRGRIQRL